MTRERRFIATAMSIATAIAVVCTSAALVSAQTTVLVVPGNPDADTTGAASAVSDAGFSATSIDRDETGLTRAVESAKDREQAALTALSVGLEAAKAKYLDQDFATMVSDLTSLREQTLWLVSEGQNRKLLWQLSFQLGLAHHSSGNEKAANLEFAFAGSIDAERRPPSDIYGPDVGQAFATALTEAAATKPFRVNATPVDANVSIDGVALVGAAGRPLVAGLHVVKASAPGHKTQAVLVDTRDNSTLDLQLEELEGGPVAKWSEAWARGELRPGRATSNQLLLDTAREYGAAVTLWIGSGSPVEVIALDADGQTATESAATPAAAVAAVLERLSPSGKITTRDVVGGTTTSGSSNRKWLIAGGVGVIVVAAVVAGVILASGDGGGNGDADRIQIGIVP